MAKKKKRLGDIWEIPPEDIQQGPLRYEEGLTPLLERLARDLFAKIGRFLYRKFEQWELRLTRGVLPWREILIWEHIARTFDDYVTEHPEATDSKKIVSTIVSISVGTVFKEETETTTELRELYMKTETRWVPPIAIGEPFEFPPDGTVAIEYRDIVAEEGGMFFPNLRGDVDARQILLAADIILGKDAGAESVFGIYGKDRLEEGGIPEGMKTVVVQLDVANEETAELEKMCHIVEQIKGRHDYPTQ